MKYVYKIVAFTFFICFGVNAATLSVPRTVNLLIVNGEKVNEPSSVNLDTGSNQVVFRYSESLRNGTTDRKFESLPYVAIINVVSAEDNLEISHKYFRNYKMAEAAFNTGNQGWKLNYNGVDKQLKVDVLPKNDGLMPYLDISKSLNNYNGSKKILDSKNSLTSEAGNNSSTLNHIKEEDVKAWFKSQPLEKKKSILKWMIEQ